VESALLKKLVTLPDGLNTVTLSLRMRYNADVLTAVYDRPSPTPQMPGLRVTGSYVAHRESSSASEVGETIAEGQFMVRMSDELRARLNARLNA
jgi:hypothetical protein